METIDYIFNYSLGILLAFLIVFGLYGLGILIRDYLMRRRDSSFNPSLMRDSNIVSREHNPPEVEFPDTEPCRFHKKDIQDDFQKEDDLE